MDKELIDNFVNLSILRHTCSILIKDEKLGHRPYGSGVFVKLNQKHYILTASHVLDSDGSENEHFIYTDLGILPIVGKEVRTDLALQSKYDLAYIELHNDMLKHLTVNYSFLDSRYIETEHSVSNNLNYLVLGYPENNKVISKSKTRFLARYFVLKPSKEKAYKYYGFDNIDFHLFDFKGKLKIETGSKIDIDEPHGISGCGAWTVSYENINGKNVFIYGLVGLMTEFKKGRYYVLVGNKLDRIINKMIL